MTAQERVIARLLDGWMAQVGWPLKQHQRWILPGRTALSDRFADMPDDEATIVRAHQEAKR